MNYKKIFLVAFLFIVIFGFAKASFINEAIASPSPYIKVISPNGGEVVSFDKPFSIAWSSAGTQLAYIYLLSPDGGTCRIDGVNASLGKYSKVIKQGEKCLNTSKTIQPGQYKILIYGDTQGAEDTSDGFFDLTGGVVTTTVQPDIATLSENDGISFIQVRIIEFKSIINNLIRQLNFSVVSRPTIPVATTTTISSPATTTTKPITTTTIMPLIENDISFMQARMIEFKSMINNLMQQLGVFQW